MSILAAPGAVAGGVLNPIGNAIKNPFSRSISKDAKADFPRGFEIVEIIDGSENSATKLALVGNMLPQIPFEFGGEQRLGKEYYPGYGEPSVQVLGPKESEITIHGKFKDKRFKDESKRGISYEISKALDAMRLRGNILKLTLGEWVRYGFLEKTDFKMNQLTDVEYSLTFFITGFALPKNNYLVSKHKAVPFDVNQSLINQFTAWQTTYSKMPIEMPVSIADILNGAISDVATAVNAVTNFVDTVISTAESIESAAFRAIGLVKNARASISKFKRRIGFIKTDMSTLSNQFKASEQFVATFKNQLHLTSAVVGVSTLAAFLASLQREFEAITKTIPMARYKVIAGDTLQKIAVKFYKDGNQWKLIYDHNHLTSTVLTAGQMLEIPRQ